MIIAAGNLSLHGTPFQYVREHRIEYWASSVNYGGQQLVCVGRQEQLRRGLGISLIKPGVRHHYMTTAPEHRLEFIWVLFRPWTGIRPYLELPEQLPGAGWLSLEQHPHGEEIANAYRLLLQGWSCSGPLVQRITENALERAWLLLADSQRTGRRQRDERLEAALDHIQTHFTQRLDVPMLARISHLSASRFAHLFKTVMGMSPMHYVDSLRMEEAKSLLLATNLPIKTIAQRVGYENQFHFSKRFRNCLGCSPSNIRKHPGQ